MNDRPTRDCQCKRANDRKEAIPMPETLRIGSLFSGY